MASVDRESLLEKKIEVGDNSEAMDLGKRCSLKRDQINTNEEIGHVRYTRGLGRKKVVIAKDMLGSVVGSSPSISSMKKPCRKKSILDSGLSVLESLPKENAKKVICCVDHDDITMLLQVSNTIKEEALIAKQSHFAYGTPSKAQPVIDVGNLSGCRDVEKPMAHRISRYKSPLNEEKLASISVNLFHLANGEELWPKKDSF